MQTHFGLKQTAIGLFSVLFVGLVLSVLSGAARAELAGGDVVAKGFQTNAARKLLTQWEADKTLDKLYVRDEKGNLVASSKNRRSTTT